MRGRVAAGAGLIIVVAAVMVGLWLKRMHDYDSIDDGSSYYGTRYVQGERAEYAFGLVNDGDRDVKITAVSLPRSSETVQEPRVRLEDPDLPGPRRPTEPFRPFELKAGQERFVVVRFRTGPCRALTRGSSVRIEGQDVRYDVGPFTRTQRIRFSPVFRFTRGSDRECRGG